jgi:plastocyanin
MSPPGQNATADQQRTFFDLVKKQAKTADAINLNKCEKVSPLVFQVKQGQDYKVQNSDTVAHTISLRGTSFEVEVPAGTTKTVKADFDKTGAYGYVCDNLGGVVGYIFVVE